MATSNPASSTSSNPSADSSMFAGPGICAECGYMSAQRSFDKLCFGCLISDRNRHELTAEAGLQINAELETAISGLAGELLKPCVGGCHGHLREAGEKLYREGLMKYDVLASGLS